MRIFLAGATGAIGTALVPLLLDAGHEVIGTSRSTGGVDRLNAAGATGVRLDVFDRTAVRDALLGCAPDAVIHQLTALSDGSMSDNARIRVEGTRNLVDAARAAGVPHMIAESIAFAYAPGDTLADEATPLDPTTAEPRATTVSGVRALEEAVADMPKYVILRYGLFYGPGTGYAPGGPMSRWLRATDGVTSFIHVHDAAAATVLALNWPNGTVNIVDDDPAPGREWAPVMAAALGVPAPEPKPGRAPWERGADNTLAHKLGWHPHFPSWRTGFSEQGVP